ncbi:MAG: hypothetical protein ABIQ31_01715 [Ferruginibacter sp.]
MNKKDLERTIKILNDQAGKPKRGRPITQFKEITKTSQEGTKEGETRATFIVKESVLVKIKGIAHWGGYEIKEVVNNALKDAIRKYEKANGTIQPPPTRKL